MKEKKADLFAMAMEDGVDAICITTNGQYLSNGKAAMEGGCARVCADRWPETAFRLGKLLKQLGNNVPYVIGALDKDANYLEPTRQMIRDKSFKCLIFSFPTINKMMDGANLQLIKQSATLLKSDCDQYELSNIICPRQGTGIGGLHWADVKPEVEKILDDRFTIVSFENEE